MSISASARWRMERPRSSATPYSVTTLSTRFLWDVTTAPGLRVAWILEIVPPWALEWVTMNE